MNGNNRVRTGFRLQDEQYLNRFDNAAADPDVQIFDNEDDEEPEQARLLVAENATSISLPSEFGQSESGH